MDSERGQSNNGGVDHDEMMKEAQSWKTDIMDNYSGTPACDIPMMILINKKNSEAVAHTAGSGMHVRDHADLGRQGGITHEQLMELAINNGFSSWYVVSITELLATTETALYVLVSLCNHDYAS